MKTIRINETAYHMLAAAAADTGVTMRGAIQVVRATASHPGVWQIEVEQYVFDRLLVIEPPNLSDTVITICSGQA